MKNLSVKIISPYGIQFDGECYIAVLPSAHGDMGVMADHELFVVALREGKITLQDDKEKIIKEFDVKDGFAEMDPSGELVVLLPS